MKLTAIAALFLATALAAAAPLEDSMARGETLYLATCTACHQAEGLGVPPVFPPLAESDWLLADRGRAARVLAEGLTGEIIVKGQTYSGAMPAQMLNDRQAADVLTFITNSWGNSAEPFTPEEVAEARLTTRFKTYEALLKANTYQDLPTAPEGWAVAEVVRLDRFPTRLAGPDANGDFFVLFKEGDVSRLREKTLVPWLAAKSFIDSERGSVTASGLTVGPDRRLWMTSNQRVTAENGMIENEVTIWRGTAETTEPEPAMTTWFQTRFPYGVGPFNHGISHLAFGPDGKLWVSSGSRTDSGEEGVIPDISKEGETPLTAGMWSFDVDLSAEKSATGPEMIARGIRNAYGFAWDADGNLFTASNGPDADLAEESDVITPGSHYGFPFQFAEKPATSRFYEHTPAAPPGLEFRKPVENLGPDGGAGFFTFTPHSSPGGMVWCGPDFPEPLKNRFVVTRFGNMIAIPEDSGFDLLTFKPTLAADGSWQAEVRTLLPRLGRPLDVIHAGKNRLLILEYSRVTDQKSRLGMIPGRIIELRAE